MNVKPHSRSIRVKRSHSDRGTDTHVDSPARRKVEGPALGKVDGPRVATSLDAWLARDWSQGVHLAALDEFQQLHICTQNTLYEIIVINHCGDVRVRGGRYFPDWTAARLAGSTAGGSCLRRLGINLGLQLEFEVDRRRIITSPVRTIAVLQNTISA
jgi:hypothetical protein